MTSNIFRSGLDNPLEAAAALALAPDDADAARCAPQMARPH